MKHSTGKASWRISFHTKKEEHVGVSSSAPHANARKRVGAWGVCSTRMNSRGKMRCSNERKSGSCCVRSASSARAKSCSEGEESNSAQRRIWRKRQPCAAWIL